MPEQWTIVETCASEVEADLIVSMLLDAGIEACVPNRALPSIYPSVEFVTGVDVAVPAADVDAAREILGRNSA